MKFLMYYIHIMSLNVIRKIRELIALALLFIFSLISFVNPGKLAYAQSISATPSIISSIAGNNNDLSSPPSPTIAANPNEQIELVNNGYLIHTNKGVVYSGSANILIGTTGTYTSDPQVIWDASSNKFYFSYYEVVNGQNGIVWGFSKTANPTGPKNFCTYYNTFNYGSTTFPDRQNLGDTKDFLLISSNRYFTSNYGLDGSDIAWIAKPLSVTTTTCPTASSLSSGIQALKNPDGVTSPWLPTSSKQVDANSTGYIIGVPNYVSGNTLTEYSVTKNIINGSAIIGKATSIPIVAYSYPPNVPQKGTTLTGAQAPLLQTQTYLTSSIMAYDPRLGHNTIWTAQTVAGGAGSQVQWYEINPSASVIDQTGTITDSTLNIFNPTISPDRIVIGAKSGFGSSAIINVSTSSNSSYPSIAITSTVNGQLTSPLLTIKQSTGPNIDFSCVTSCRYGDYSGAVPNPAAPLTGTHGQVFMSNQWNNTSINDNTPIWQTLISLISF